MAFNPVMISASEELTPPAFVVDARAVRRNVDVLKRIRAGTGCHVLFTLKPMSNIDVLRLIVPEVDGLAASSYFEAALARDVLNGRGSVHITTPGFRPDEIDVVADLCDTIAFNSLPQWKRLSPSAAGRARCGLRVNPGLSFVADERYNPCRPHSKLGVPMEQLTSMAETDPDLLRDLTGLHFHTNCEASTLDPLLQTVHKLADALPAILDRIDWINLGGGYLLPDCPDTTPLQQAAELLQDRFSLDVFVEPGAAVVRDAACLVAGVIDLFDSQGQTVAVLDTTVNHLPEVFEYQFRPTIHGDVADGPHRYLLAGCTCLAGDLFGTYAFDKPLEIGSRVIFPNVGAYTTVKWHWFNGVSLPTIYGLTESGTLAEQKRFSYGDFRSHCGG